MAEGCSAGCSCAKAMPVASKLISKNPKVAMFVLRAALAQEHAPAISIISPGMASRLGHALIRAGRGILQGKSYNLGP